MVHEEKWLCNYLIWYGDRTNYNCVNMQEVGVIKGEWFYLPNGKRKKISANGFRKIRQI